MFVLYVCIALCWGEQEGVLEWGTQERLQNTGSTAVQGPGRELTAASQLWSLLESVWFPEAGSFK